MAATLREYPGALDRVLASVAMQRALARKLQPAQEFAEHIAPVRSGRYKTGDVEPGGFHIRSGVRDGRAYARLYNDTPYARYLEFGTRYMRAQRILGRSVDAIRG